MGKTRDPYNPAYCKAANCPHRKGNRCYVLKCTHNHKRIVYWERTGVIIA